MAYGRESSLLISEHVLEGQRCWETPLGSKELSGTISFPCPSNKHMVICGSQCNSNTFYLTCYHCCPAPSCYGRSALSNTLLARTHAKKCHKSVSMQATQQQYKQHYSQVTPASGRERDNYTHQSDCVPSRGLEANSWSDCRPCPPTKASQGTTQGKHPAIWCYCISGKCLV